MIGKGFLPYTRVSATIPPVDVPMIQSNSSVIFLPVASSSCIRASICTKPFIPPPSRNSNLLPPSSPAQVGFSSGSFYMGVARFKKGGSINYEIINCVQVGGDKLVKWILTTFFRKGGFVQTLRTPSGYTHILNRHTQLKELTVNIWEMFKL